MPLLSRSTARPAFLPGISLTVRLGNRRSSLSQVRRYYRDGLASVRCTATPSRLVSDAVERACRLQDDLNAFITIDAGAAESAKAGPIDQHLQAIAVKDNICTRGIVTTAGSKILDGFVPPYTATAVQRLQDAGAVVIGKTNMDEFGMGSSTENSAYFPTYNPWDVSRVPGGSSGGSAAAVASGICAVALGTDTGGSVRQPASYCGVTGLRPSYGRVSRHGLLAYASSLDAIGPITRTVADAAKILQIIAGHDPKDATTVKAAVPDYSAAISGSNNVDLSQFTIGIVSETFGKGVDPEVSAAVREAVEDLRRLGASIRMVSLPRFASATAAHYVLAPSEASANLARYDGVRFGVRNEMANNATDLYAMSRAQGFGSEVKRRIMVGTFALSTGYYEAYYLRAQRVRKLVAMDYRQAFESGVDVLVSPVAPTTAFRIGEKMSDPVSMYLEDCMTIPASLAGLPALSVPCGMSSEGLPIGMQIVGPFLDEPTVLRIGHAFQCATKHHTAVSPMAQKVDSASAVST